MTIDFQFVEATREQLKLRMALVGVTGGGKTWTALTLASYLLADKIGPDLTKRIAVIDSERGSSRRYAKGKPFYFSVLELKSFAPETYVEAIKAAERAGFEAIVIDSFSHEWSGTDGALEQVDRAAKRMRNPNSFTAWGDVTPRHNAVIDAIMDSPLHVIATMRAKMAYEQTVEDGKKVVKKLGLEPVQRSGVEFEFDIVGELDVDNTMAMSKSRCADLTGKVIRKPGRDLAKTIVAWLDDGEAPAPRQQAEQPRREEPRRETPAVERMPPQETAEAAQAVADAAARAALVDDMIRVGLKDATTLTEVEAIVQEQLVPLNLPKDSPRRAALMDAWKQAKARITAGERAA